MHIAKEILGSRFFLPSMMIDARKLALFLGNKRLKMSVAWIIEVLGVKMYAEAGLNKSIISEKDKEKSH